MAIPEDFRWVDVTGGWTVSTFAQLKRQMQNDGETRTRLSTETGRRHEVGRRMPKTPNGYFFPMWQVRFNRALKPGTRKRASRHRAEDSPPLATSSSCRPSAAPASARIPWGLKAHGVVWHTATRARGATRLLRDYGVDVRTVQIIGSWRSLDQMAEYLGVDLHTLSAAPHRAVAARRNRA